MCAQWPEEGLPLLQWGPGGHPQEQKFKTFTLKWCILGQVEAGTHLLHTIEVSTHLDSTQLGHVDN